METKADMPSQENGSPKELAGTQLHNAPQGAAEFDDRELDVPEASHKPDHNDDEYPPEEPNAGAAVFDDRELDEPEASHKPDHNDDEYPPEEPNAGAAVFDDRELDEPEASQKPDHNDDEYPPEEPNAGAAVFDDRELDEPEASHKPDHNDDEYPPEEPNAGAAEFKSRELGVPAVSHKPDHNDDEYPPKELNADVAEFKSRELDDAVVKELEEYSSVSGVAPGRRSSIRSVLYTIEEKEKELRELAAREAAVESQLQLYSEVIGLRKELQVVRRDTERVKRQLDSIDALVEKYDPAVERDLNSVEEEAQRSDVQQVWTRVCQEKPNESLEDPSSWITVDLDGLPQRLRAAREKFLAAGITAADLYRAQEEMINTNTDERDKAKAKVLESFAEEMAKLTETRSRLKQLDDDQRFHFRRGTHVKQRHVSSQKEQDLLKGRVYNVEAKQFGDVVALADEYKELTEWVKGAKRELEDNKRSYAEEQSQLEEQLRVAEDNGKEAREVRQLFERENEQLKGLKQDIQHVLIFARMRNREAFT